jgi:hypothetical protein
MASRIAKRANVTQGGVMLGVLIDANGLIAVATSGDDATKALRVTNATAALYQTAVIAPSLVEFHINTLLGHDVNLFELGYCRTPGDNTVATPGNCAAPKLIGYALSQGWVTPFAMSEAWSRSQQNVGFKYAQNEPIESCNTCCKLVPLMLCTGVAG